MAGHPPARAARLDKFRNCVSGMLSDHESELVIRKVDELARARTIRPLMTLLRKAGAH
jgi:hypothetical protein